VRWNTVSAVTVLSGMTLLGCGGLVTPDVERQLVGSWTWVESSGGIAGGTQTPASTGEELILRFSLSSVVQVIRNDELERSVRFTTSPTTEDDTFSILYDEPLLGFDSQTASLDGPDTLILADACCDGFVYRFERIP